MRFFVQKTMNTPMIQFDDGVLVISGKSHPENAHWFFEPFLQFVEGYSKKPFPYTEVNIILEYTNCSTNRSLMALFTLLEKLYEKGNNVTVNWYSETNDDQMYILGVDFKAMFRLPFTIRESESIC
ncbi:MAG TPA: DUF1987 domain-containing protein [Bacteroidales bacterium]